MPEPRTAFDTADEDADVEVRARLLSARLAPLDAEARLRWITGEAFVGRVALLSSFGAEAAVTLHLLSRTAPDTPVLFLDTGLLFAQTLAHRDALVARLGLTDVRTLTPAADAPDPRSRPWLADADGCCRARKVLPLQAALAGFDCLVTGRKRHHGGARGALPLMEAVDGGLRLNLIADWDAVRIAAYRAEHDLPDHPLVAEGFTSLGCWPCSRPAEVGDADVRSGRWAGRDKTECGIHLPLKRS